MSKNKFIIDLNNRRSKDDQEDKSSDDDELTIPKNDNKQVRLNKNGKPRAEYVLTDKRKQQFDIARNARMKNIESKKIVQNENYSKYDNLKKELEQKKMKKLEKIKQKELVKLMAETENISTDEDSDDDEIIIKKSKAVKKKKQKKVIVESESSESETETSIKPKPKYKPKPKHTVVEPIVPIQQLKKKNIMYF